MCLLASNWDLILRVSCLYASNLREESNAILNAFLNNEATLLLLASVNGRIGTAMVIFYGRLKLEELVCGPLQSSR